MASPSTTPTTGESGPNGDVMGAVENMLKVSAAHRLGQSHGALLAEEGITPAAEALPPPTTAEVAYTVAAESALIQARPAEMATVVPPPGLTERGWSSEVTARHPDLIAATMAELAASGATASSTEDPIDPNDPDALAQALALLGGNEVRKNNLRVAAAQLNNERLSQGLQDAVNASPAVQASYAEAIEQAQAASGPDGGETAPAAASAPKAATSTTSKSGSTTTSSTSSS